MRYVGRFALRARYWRRASKDRSGDVARSRGNLHFTIRALITTTRNERLLSNSVINNDFLPRLPRRLRYFIATDNRYINIAPERDFLFSFSFDLNYRLANYFSR